MNTSSITVNTKGSVYISLAPPMQQRSRVRLCIYAVPVYNNGTSIIYLIVCL